ncbi:MAG: aminotransferase class I/II-fold pyridoxal phosphate-dependent enzyme [Candidatus Brocadiia bacterium]
MEFDALKRSGIANLLSSLGRSIFLPQGIFHWLGRAKQEARINATIGSARGPESEILDGGSDQTVTFYLPALQAYFGTLTSEETFPYAPMLGLPELRAAWRRWILAKLADHRDRVEPCLSLPAITPGITGGLHVAAKLFVEPGEVVVSPDRRWGNYSNIIERNVGGRIETFPFFEGTAFNIRGMQRKLVGTLASQPKALLMLNFPNNPVGFGLPAQSAGPLVEALVEAVEETDKSLVVLVDDAYEGYVYEEGVLARSLFAELCDAHRRILPIKLDGASKELLFYGGRVGALSFGLPSAPEVDRQALQAELDNKVAAVVRSTVSNGPRPVQAAVLKALGEMGEVLDQRRRVIDVLGRRARLLARKLAEAAPPQLKPLPFNAGFFCFCDLEGLSATALADHLMTRYRTGVVPTESGKVNGIRIAFCSVPEAQIPELVANLGQAVADLAGQS